MLGRKGISLASLSENSSVLSGPKVLLSATDKLPFFRPWLTGRQAFLCSITCLTKTIKLPNRTVFGYLDVFGTIDWKQLAEELKILYQLHPALYGIKFYMPEIISLG